MFIFLHFNLIKISRMFYWVKNPKWLGNLYSNILFRKEEEEKIIYLTFDDGPIPKVTPWVLDILAAYKAKATFFCIGDNVRKYTNIYTRLKKEGHSIGNHTHNHLNAWSVNKKDYLENIQKCMEFIDSDFFRPPYGKLTPSLSKSIRIELGLSIVLWDILSGDFDQQLSPERCWFNMKDKIESGSIIVFHDSLKAWPRLSTVLPKLLIHFTNQGYKFKAL
jgi:peptidoglycan/xylan/chitin deacetylase (PgdA/CDA1 family)